MFNAGGAIAGGIFLSLFGHAAFFGFAGILLVFLISGLLRFAITLFFAPRLSHGREIPAISDDRTMVMNLVAVYPSQGAVQHAFDGLERTRKIVASGTLRGGWMIKEGLGATGEIIRDSGRKIASRIARRKRL